MGPATLSSGRPRAQFFASDWLGTFSAEERARALEALEAGGIVDFPSMSFAFAREEIQFLNPDVSDGRAKNVSFDPRTGWVDGTGLSGEARDSLIALLHRFSNQSLAFISELLPDYADGLEQGRASFRPVEIDQRPASSYRKDDRRIHVDAFPSQPLQGRRILRLFTNVNMDGMPRVWHVGEPFADFARRFISPASYGLPGSGRLLALLGITKGRRTPYDQVMLSLHDRAKADQAYQQDCMKTEIRFPAGSTWIAFTDIVPHAVVAGQHALEQTFYLSVSSMRQPEYAPLRILERMTSRRLTD